MDQKNTRKLKNILYAALLVLSTGRADLVFSKAKKTPKIDPNKEEAVSASVDGVINKHSLGIGVGETFLAGDFRDHGDKKITADLYYTYSASYSFDFLANFHFSEHEFLEESVTIPGLVVGIKSRLYQFDSFSPYVLGGMGFYRPFATREVKNKRIQSERKLTFGYHLGGGVDLRLNKKIVVGLIGHYHNPFDVKQENGPELEGAYFKLLITTMYTF